MSRSWRLAGLALTLGVLLAVWQFVAGLVVVGVVELAVFALLAYLWSPLFFPRSIGAAEAQRRSTVDRRPIVYWRPGCQYCLRLRLRLGRTARRAHWVNIWADPAGAAAVRAIAGGNETVPTVVWDGQAQVNPDPGTVRERLWVG